MLQDEFLAFKCSGSDRFDAGAELAILVFYVEFLFLGGIKSGI